VHRVGVVHCESGAHQAVDVVDLRAADVRNTEVVDKDLNPFVVDHDIVGSTLVVERHAVLHARAAAAADEDAEGKLRVGLLGHELLQARLGFGGE